MAKKRPGKQKWRVGSAPSRVEIRAGRRGFGPTGVSQIESLAAKTGLFPLFVGPRTIGATTLPRCYLFFNEDSFHRGEENLACIDGIADKTRLILRPFGRGANRMMLLPVKLRSRFQKSDKPDWLHIKLSTSEDWKTASSVMKEIKSKYNEEFEIS